MADTLGKAAYSKPAQPEIITTVDVALSAGSGLGEDASAGYATMS